MKRISTILIVSCLAAMLLPHLAKAQQDPQFSQYMFNRFYLNPGATGINQEWAEASLLHRSQWLGYQGTFDDGGAPNTQLLTFNIPVTKYNFGVGLHVLNDNLGPLNTTEILLSLAYHIKLKNDRIISIGGRGGFLNSKISFDKLRFVDDRDPLNIGSAQNEMTPDFAAGIYYSSPKYFGGISVNHLQEPALNYGRELVFNTLVRHANILIGANYDVSDNIRISPTAIMKSDLNSYSFEFSAVGSYDDKYELGLSMRELEAAIIMVGMRFMKDNRMRLGYAFDYTMVARNAKETSSHEIMLTYRMPAIKFFTPSPIRTPRFRY